MLDALTDSSSVKTQHSAVLAWVVCLSAALFFFYEFIQMNMFNAISSDLMRNFHIHASTLGYLSATYLLADVIFLFPAGLLLDRLPVRTLILSAMILCIIGTLAFAITTSFTIAAIAHFMAGIGNAFCFLSCIKLASRWFAPRQMALVIGTIVTFAMVGGMVAQTPLALLNESLGWRNALLLNAGLGVFILAIIWYVVQDYPPQQQAQNQQQKQTLHAMGLFESIKLALANPQNWLGGLYTSLLNLPIMVLGALWGSLHLVQVHHLLPAAAANVTSMIFLGTIIGAPLVGMLSDRLGYRRAPMIVFGVLSLITILAIIYLPNPSYAMLLVLYLLLGLFTSAQVLSYPLIAESNPRFLTGTATGLASVIIMGGGGVSQPLFGWLLDSHWDHLMVKGVPIFSQSDFSNALLMIPIAFAIGLLASLLIKETNCHPLQPNQVSHHASP
jgi:MFS family permease